jgi:hypothetical protein
MRDHSTCKIVYKISLQRLEMLMTFHSSWMAKEKRVTLSLYWKYAVEAHWGEGENVLVLGTSCRWVVSFMPGRFTLGETAPPQPPVPIGLDVGWTPEPVCTTWWSENCLPYRDSSSEPSLVQTVGSSYTDCATAARKHNFTLHENFEILGLFNWRSLRFLYFWALCLRLLVTAKRGHSWFADCGAATAAIRLCWYPPFVAEGLYCTHITMYVTFSWRRTVERVLVCYVLLALRSLPKFHRLLSDWLTDCQFAVCLVQPIHPRFRVPRLMSCHFTVLWAPVWRHCH